MANNYAIGMRGVYLVAAELAGRGWITSPIARSARGADLLMTASDLTKAYSVEVKTTSKHLFRLAQHAKDIKSQSHLYILVRVNKNDVKDVTYYVVPSKIISKLATPGHPRLGKFVVFEKDVLKYKDKWPRRI